MSLPHASRARRESMSSHGLRGSGLALLGLAACFSPTSVDESDTDPITGEPGSESGPGGEGSTAGPVTATGDGATDAVDSSSDGGPVCGDGSIDGDEECDLGAGNSDNAACTSECRLAACGDGLVHLGREDCDDAGQSSRCDADCTAVSCGDGTVNADAGEQCEADGPQMTCTACQVVCDDGFDDCNADVETDGCETSLDDPATCGSCGNACGMAELCMDQGCVPDVATFLLSERNASTVWEWDPATGSMMVFHSVQTNDADCNAAEGSPSGWVVDHFDDSLGAFTPGTGMGLDLTVGVTYAFPKHVTVFDNQVVVMSRNDATLVRYEPVAAGVLGSTPTGNGVGQGMATDGTSLWASFWDSGASNSLFVRYDAAFMVQETIPNPAGLGGPNNVFDLAFSPPTGRFFGLATVGEAGTGTTSSTVYEFDMGGAVVATYPIPFAADGIGQSACP